MLDDAETNGKFLLYYVHTLNSGFSDFECRLFIHGVPEAFCFFLATCKNGKGVP